MYILIHIYTHTVSLVLLCGAPVDCFLSCLLADKCRQAMLKPHAKRVCQAELQAPVVPAEPKGPFPAAAPTRLLKFLGGQGWWLCSCCWLMNCPVWLDTGSKLPALVFV